jgi:hypothetical protein
MERRFEKILDPRGDAGPEDWKGNVMKTLTSTRSLDHSFLATRAGRLE